MTRDPRGDGTAAGPADVVGETVADAGRPAPAAGRPPVPRVVRVAAIVLAGGMSHRFGSDKLAAPYGDGALLDAAIRAAAAVADEVIVTIRPTGDEPPLPAGLPVPVRCVRDAEEGGGPLAALPAGLAATAAPVVLVVAGDTPNLPPGVAFVLLDALAGPGPARPGFTVGGDRGRASAAALLVDGSFRPLPLALRRDPAARMVVRLLAEGERRLRALLVSLGATAVPEEAWRPADPDGLVFLDVDVPDDLANLERPGGDQ
jgi:molybdopterin-guanine dinucleotide biosynthesis protein A